MSGNQYIVSSSSQASLNARNGSGNPWMIDCLILENVALMGLLSDVSHESQQPERQSSKYGFGASADVQLQEDMLDVRLHRLRRDLECPSDVLVR
jgi:hypothetical protein